MREEDYKYNYTEKVNNTLKRVKVTFDYHNEASLDAMLTALREELLSGQEKIDVTIEYASKTFLIFGEQLYRNPRQFSIVEKDGIKYQIVKSRI